MRMQARDRNGSIFNRTAVGINKRTSYAIEIKFRLTRRVPTYSTRKLCSIGEPHWLGSNAKSVPPQSPGLARGTSAYPGFGSAKRFQLQRGCVRFQGGARFASMASSRWGATPSGLRFEDVHAPRVVAALQPWASRRNPVGIRLLDDLNLKDSTFPIGCGPFAPRNPPR